MSRFSWAFQTLSFSFFMIWGCWWFWVGVWEAFFEYILAIKRKGKREEEEKIPAVLAGGLLRWFGLLQLPCVALLLFLDALSKPNIVISPTHFPECCILGGTNCVEHLGSNSPGGF